MRRVPHFIDFETPSDEAICLHEAGHACAALIVGLVPEFIEFVDDEGSEGRARNRMPIGDPQQRRLVACAAYAVEYNLFRAGRLTSAAGGTITEKAFIHIAIGALLQRLAAVRGRLSLCADQAAAAKGSVAKIGGSQR